MKNKKEELLEEKKGWMMQLTVKSAVVNKDGKVLLLKRADKEITNSAKYDLPGGGIERGETVEKSLQRELAEELGLKNINS